MTLLADDRNSRERGGSTDTFLPPTSAYAPASADAELLAAVRAGDTRAYAELYELHHSAVRRLARRLCRDRHEADDVVSEVFANTLRAIRNGGGPDDEFAAYALRSVRNTVAKLRTRTDTARATPTATDDLDTVDPDDPFVLEGDIEQAFRELPDRFRAVLWTTAVEGRTAAELSALDGDVDAGAAASLSLRARKALGRSYLRVRTHRPCRDPECNRVRSYLPGYVQRSAAASTVARIDAHLAVCAECTEVRDEMLELNGRLRTIPWLALLAAAIRRAAGAVTTVATPAAATAAAPAVAIAVSGSLIVAHEAIERIGTDDARDAAAVFAEAAPIAPADAAAAPAGAAAAGTGTGAAPASGGQGAPDDVASDADVIASGPDEGSPGDDTPASDDRAVGDGGTDRPPGAHAGPGPAPMTPDVEEGGGPAAPPSDGRSVPVTPDAPGEDPSAIGGLVVGGAVGGAVDGVVTGVTDGVLPAVGATTGDLLAGVGTTVDDVVGVVGALPGGLPAVGAATGELLTGVGDTLHTTVTNVGATVGVTVDAVAATATATVDQVLTTVDNTVAHATGTLGGSVGAVLDVDPDDPLGDTLSDVLGDDGLVDGLLGPDGTVATLLGGLLGGGSNGSGAPACLPLPLLPCP